MRLHYCYRALQADEYEMICTLSIDADLLKEPLGYKYVVYSARMAKDTDCYEKLHPFNLNDDPNRCLRIPSNIHHRAYGGMIFLSLHNSL